MKLSVSVSQITNLGRPLKYFANASLNIHWPKENSVGKWLLYLTQITGDGVQSVSCSPAEEINPLKHVKVIKTFQLFFYCLSAAFKPSCNWLMFDIKGWLHPARKRREAEHEALSTDVFPFLPKKREHKTLVRLY